MRLWLTSLCILVALVTIVGGITRITGSGLSIVEWQPVTGILPPLDEDGWRAAFDAYQRYPEFRLVNSEISLTAFKRIFLWEYLHRVLARLVGLTLGLPLLLFWIGRRLDRRLAASLALAMLLVTAQAVVGWYMVKSGLVRAPRVSHYRLAAHLGLASLLFAHLFWLRLTLGGRSTESVPPPLWIRRRAYVLTGLALLQIICGAFVSGLRAGYGYNTFPSMNGAFFPAVALPSPIDASALLENGPVVQFTHRMLAWSLLFAAGAYWFVVRRTRQSLERRSAADGLLAAVGVQFALGVATLVLVVPPALAVVHQANALLVLAAAVRCAFTVRWRRPQVELA